MGLVGQIFHSNMEGIALINCIEFPLCHHRRSQGGNQLAGQYPLRPDDHVLSCRAIDMCYCFATPFKYNYCFLSFQIQDNEYDFRGTAQYGLMLSHLYCLMCLLQMCQHQLQDEAAS